MALAILVTIDASLAGTRGTVPLYSANGIRGEFGTYRFDVVLVAEHMQLGYFIATFLFLSAMHHAFACACSTVYERYLKRGTNPFRWLEYTFSASTMSVVIAAECGVVEVKLLAAIVLLTATCMFFGALGDQSPEHNALIGALGCVPFLAKWALCLAAFFANVHASSSGGSGSGVPAFVIALVCTLIVLESLFGVNQVVRLSGGVMSREIGFMVLSATAKLTLAGLTWGGTAAMH